MSDLRNVSGRSCSNSRQPRPDECELGVNIRRKIFTMRQKLLLDLKRLHNALIDYSSPDHYFEHELP